ncbi:MAG: HDIG domain-containing protein [Rikenellaceae bacterium]
MSEKIKIFIAFAITSVILTLLIPVEGSYKYALGEHWNYKDMTAEFDFQILKTKEGLEADYDEFEKGFTSIYSLNTGVVDEIIEKLSKKYEVPDSDTLDVSSLTDSQQIGSELKKTLISIYDVGVISIRERQNSASIVRIEKDGALMLVPVSAFYTPQTASEYINNHLKKILNSDVQLDVSDLITDNVEFEKDLTLEFKEEERKAISIAKGFVPKGAGLIKEGDFIGEKEKNILDSYLAEYSNVKGGASNWYIIIGNYLFVMLLLTLNYFFYVYFRREYSAKAQNVLFILFIFVFMMVLTRLVIESEVLSLYVIPYAIVPLYIITFYDIRMSVFEYMTVLLMCLYITPIPFELMFLNLTAGLAATFVVQDSYHRTRVFKATGVMLLVYCAGYVTLNFMQNQTFNSINWLEMLWFVGNVCAMLALYQLIYLFESVFGFVTNITLFELCDTNKPLLQELAQKAPGTFQHSLQVANLAATAASQIGANSLLARTGALYHDIGKIDNPIYFIENVSDGYSPHDKLEPLQSVEYIKEHVTAGLKLAKKYNLPNKISDFIVSHHGTSKIYYFYHAYVTKYGEPIDESMFSYSGHLPDTREAAICMMADSVEAASRSMKEYTIDSITQLVNKIVDKQIDDGQFNNAPLSLSEIAVVKDVFVNKLSNIYHTRIVYPERLGK